MQAVTLNSGTSMPIVGFGVFQVDDGATEQAVADALAAGYRLIDTAAAYRNEAAVGRAIAASGIPREELFITTKLWVQDAPGEANALRAFDASATRLGLDYLDLYLVHQPYGDYYGEWRALQRLHAEGLARAIGVSNFMPDRLLDLVLHSDVVPAVNQVEVNPYYQRADEQAQMTELGVQIQSWGPFAEGRNGLFTDPVLRAVGDECGRSIAQVVIRWLVQRGVVVIPKSVRPERMAENLAVFDFELTADQMARIAAVDLAASQFFDHRDPHMVRELGTARVD